jgi:hypothetical protein
MPSPIGRWRPGASIQCAVGPCTTYDRPQRAVTPSPFADRRPHIERVAAVLLIEDESSHTIARARAAAATPVLNLMPMLLLFSGSFAFGCVTALTVLALAAARLDHGF